MTLVRAITTAAVTTIRYEPTGSFVEYKSHPANVNGDTAAAPVDILDLIDNLNGIRVPPLTIWQCDIDHSNLCAPPDILGEIDLLNGASGFTVWNGTSRPDNTTCVNGMFTLACSGGALGAMAAGAMDGTTTDSIVAVDENAQFADWFVNYLTTANPADSAAAEEFTLIVDSLAQWCVDHFSADERAALAARLSDPTLAFASDAGAKSAVGVIESLRK